MKLSVLSGLVPGKCAVIVDNNCQEALKERLEDLGMIPGARITCLHRSPAGSPGAYDVQGAVIALRRRDASRIWVEGV